MGAAYDAQGHLYVCNAPFGLLRVEHLGQPDTQRIELVASGTINADGTVAPILLADDLDIASDGTVYFTDATDMPPIRWVCPGAWLALQMNAETQPAVHGTVVWASCKCSRAHTPQTWRCHHVWCSTSQTTPMVSGCSFIFRLQDTLRHLPVLLILHVRGALQTSRWHMGCRGPHSVSFGPWQACWTPAGLPPQQPQHHCAGRWLLVCEWPCAVCR